MREASGVAPGRVTSGGAVLQPSEGDVAAINNLRDRYRALGTELSKVIIGQEDVIERLLICILARGHALLMGVPGLAKTTIINALSQVMSLDFNRIQFTPDL
ncbi:MAG TPA: MoxR family ATPase, partial [Methylomirabilota bacterium]|nr:MoxR family ATPase [Methylomirabilota bacterium]